jgi:hypothetical protein
MKIAFKNAVLANMGYLRFTDDAIFTPGHPDNVGPDLK